MKKYAKEFVVSQEPQRSEGWYKKKVGKPSSSGLAFLFDQLKDGSPSAKCRQYLRQLAYEKKFGIPYEVFQTKPMADGVFFEDFAKMVYEDETGNVLTEGFSYISDWFVSTPDAVVYDKNAKRKYGGLECKIVGDKTFLEIMENGIPIEHERQVQSQMMATGWDWVDYIVVNLKTKAYIILRIKRNEKLIDRIYERLHEPLDLPKLKDVGVKRFEDDLLQGWMTGNNIQEQDLVIPDLPF